MQTFSQTFTGATTWRLEVRGRYFTTLACNLPVNVRFFNQGKRLDLGEISQLSAGLEVSGIEFTAVEVDVTGADTVQIGIGTGQSRYNRLNIASNRVPQSSAFLNTQKTVTNAAANLLAANASRQYVMVQNQHASANIWLAWGTTATTSNGVKIPAGSYYELVGIAPTGALSAIGDTASNTSVVVVEG